MTNALKIVLVLVAIAAAVAAAYLDRAGLRTLRVPDDAEQVLAWTRTVLYAFAAITFVARRVRAPACWTLAFFCLAFAAQEVEIVRSFVHSGFEIPASAVRTARIGFACCVGVVAPCARFLSGSFDALASRRGLPAFPRWIVPIVAVGVWLLATSPTRAPALGYELGQLLAAASVCCYALLMNLELDRTIDLGKSPACANDRRPERRRGPRRAA